MARSFGLIDPPNISEVIDGEVMIINLESGSYFSVTGAGAAIWPQLIAGTDLDSLATILEAAFDVTAAAMGHDLGGFVDRLVEEGILRQRDPAGASSATAIGPPGQTRSYQGFGFERFDDMRGLLVIDPVHEVGGFGWPEVTAAEKKAR
jgi:hypothetical protein